MILWLACSCKRRAKLLWGGALGSLSWVLVSWLTLPLSIIISIYEIECLQLEMILKRSLM